VGSTKPQKLQARLIVATNRSLEHEVANGRFRSDLYYRLNVIGFYLPPLRERTGAIAQLARGFLNEFAGRNAGGARTIAPQAMRALEQYAWPGNVRELRNCIERAVALCGGPEILPSDLSDNVVRAGAFTAPLAPATNGVANGQPANLNLAEIKEEAELARLIHALQKHGRSRKQVAQELGISRTALYNKLNKYGLGKQNRLGLDEAPNGQDCIPVGAGICGATRATFTS
jgi:two-component system response regulator HydG